MLSTLILLPPRAGETAALAGLVRTLGALVPGTIGGVVRDVTIVSGQPNPEVRTVADHAGCALVEAPTFEAALRTALAAARSRTVFLLRAGAFVDRAFLDEAARSCEQDTPAALVLREAPEGLMRRVLPDLAPVAGLIAAASAVDPSAKDFDTLVRRVTGKRTMTARAAMAG